MGPWNTEEIDLARKTPFFTVLDYLGAYHKRDKDYSPLDPKRASIRVQVGYETRDYRFIFTGEKWVNELLPEEHSRRGGGGAIDFVRHLTNCGFVHAVRICLDAKGSMPRGLNE